MGQETKKQEQKVVRFAADEQTGNIFELKPERRQDIEAATVSILYLIAMLIFLGWQFVDISTGRMLLLKRILHESADKLDSDMCRIIAYAVIGGGLAQLSQLGTEIGTFDSVRAVSFHHKADCSADGYTPLAVVVSATSH